MGIHAVVNSFNAGELSPKLLGRPDLDAYGRGCRTMLNFLPTPYGSAERRPGMEYFGRASRARLVSFVFNDANAYILEFLTNGEVWARRYSDNADENVSTYAAVPGEYELDPDAPEPGEDESDSREMVPKRFRFPLADGEELDPWQFQFVQSADVVIMVHPRYPVYRLSRTRQDVFEMDEFPFKAPPALDIDTSGTRLKVGNPAVGASTTLTADMDFFSMEDIGKRYVITHRDSTKGVIELAKRSSSQYGYTSWMRVKGAYTMTTHGTWTGEVTVKKRYGTSAEEVTVASYPASGDFNASLSGDEPDDDMWYQVTWSCDSTATKCTMNFINPGFSMTGVVRATAFTDVKHMGCVIEKEIYSSGWSSSFREGAFSPASGYPQAIALYQERLFLAGTASSRNRIWGSATNSWDDFEVKGQEDASALDMTIASPTVSRICWMQDRDALIVGTTEDEWAVSSSSSGQSALTAANLRIRRNSAYGSCWPSPCLMAEDRLVFVQKDRARVRSLVYSWEQDSFRSEDMTLLAEHVCRAGVKEVHLQKSPDTVLWCVLENGGVVSATMDASQNVTAWARFGTTASEKGVVSMCILPSPKGEDKVYFLARRNRRVVHSGETQENPAYTLERFFPRNGWDALDTPMLDMAIRLEKPNSSHIHVRTHGSSDCPRNRIARISDSPQHPMEVRMPDQFVPVQDMALLADGGEMFPLPADSFNVQSRTFVLPREIEGGWIGIPYSSELSPMPAEFGMQDGHSMLRQKTVTRVLVDVYGTLGGEVSVNGSPATRICPRDASDGWGLPEPKRSVEVAAPFSGHSRRIETVVRQDDPWPINVSAIVQVIQ